MKKSQGETQNVGPGDLYTGVTPDERAILIAEIERLAKQVYTLKGLSPDAQFHGLPLWVQAVDPRAVEVLAKGHPLFDEFRQATNDAFEIL